MNSHEIAALEVLIEHFNLNIDAFAKFKLTPGTPLHTFQQSMIGHVKRYREQKDADTKI